MSEKIPKGWKWVKLGEVAEIKMGQSPESKYYNDKGIGLPFLQGNKTFGYRYPEIDMFCSNPIKIARKGEILISVRAPVGDINITNQDICIGRGLASINSLFNQNEFLFYCLKYSKNDLLASETGTVFGSINKDTLNNFPILLPPLPEQKSIAEVLSSIDDKIDLLHRQNKTLEEMAMTLFRQWFIEPTKDGLPEGWEEVSLGEFFPVITGKKDANFATDDGSYPFFTCSQKPLKAPSYSFDGNAILLAGNGDFNIKRYKGKFEAYQRTYVLIPYNSEYFNFLYLLMKFNLDEITRSFKGSVINYITKDMITNFKFSLPKDRPSIKDKLLYFDRIYDKVDANTSQIQTLDKLRDTLLPKLIDGEVRVAV